MRYFIIIVIVIYAYNMDLFGDYYTHHTQGLAIVGVSNIDVSS